MALRQRTLFDILDDVRPTAPLKMTLKSKGSPVNRLLQLFDVLHQAATGVPAVIVRAKDGKLIKTLLTSRSEEEIIRHMRAFFPMALADPWVRSKGLTVGMFQHCLARLVVTEALAPKPAPVRHPLIEAIFERLNRRSFDQSFATAAVTMDGVTTVIEVDDEDTRRWIMRHHDHEVWKAAEAVGMLPVDVRVRCT